MITDAALQSALFWVITQRVVVITHGVSVQPIHGTDNLTRKDSQELPLLAA
jgi:hypothetical protein